MTKDDFKKILKALNISLSRIPSDNAGYNEIMEAKILIEKEISILDLPNRNNKRSQDFYESLFRQDTSFINNCTFQILDGLTCVKRTTDKNRWCNKCMSK